MKTGNIRKSLVGAAGFEPATLCSQSRVSWFKNWHFSHYISIYYQGAEKYLFRQIRRSLPSFSGNSRHIYGTLLLVLLSPLPAHADVTSDLVAQANRENNAVAYGDDDGD